MWRDVFSNGSLDGYMHRISQRFSLYLCKYASPPLEDFGLVAARIFVVIYTLLSLSCFQPFFSMASFPPYSPVLSKEVVSMDISMDFLMDLSMEFSMPKANYQWTLSRPSLQAPLGVSIGLSDLFRTNIPNTMLWNQLQKSHALGCTVFVPKYNNTIP